MQNGSTDNLIGLMSSQSSDLLVGLLGILKSGNGFVPIDPNHPQERISFIINDCALEILVTEEKYLKQALKASEENPRLQHIICIDGASKEVALGPGVTLYNADDYMELPAQERAEVEPEQIAYVIYTSGSTGTPKGVPISHQNLMPLLLWSRDYFDLGERNKVLQNLSYCFDFGVFELLTTLLFGGTLYFPQRNGMADLSTYADYINRHAINTLHSTPSFFREIASGKRGLETLELVHLGGEALTATIVDDILEVVEDRCRIYNGYGPTEATVNSSAFEIGSNPSRRRLAPPIVPIGKASANNLLYIVDERRQLVPVGVSGELCIGGPGLARGYLNRADLTAAKFIPNPFSPVPGERLYKTGDLVRYLPDGNIEFLGRMDHQVKIRGFRVELGEVESALTRHPALRDAVVAIVEDAAGDKRLIAYVVANQEPPPKASDLRAFMRQKMPEYMVPATFLTLKQLPMTSSGKVDRRALPAPEAGHSDLEQEHLAPRSAVEEVLAQICAEVLGLKRISVRDNFFDRGCHSLLATKIISRVREAFQVELPLVAIFENPSIADLALRVESASQGEERLPLPPLEAAGRGPTIPLSFAQERLWFLSQLDPDDLSYHVPRAVRIKGPFKASLLERSFNEIIRRHEILRTTFPTVEARPVQVIHPPQPVSLRVVDLEELPAAAQEVLIERFIFEEGRQPFDLSKGPLLRVVLLRLAEQDHVLILVEHHLVHDGWSQGILLRDFLTLYRSLSAGEPSPLPALPIQYADFACWQRQWLKGAVMEAQLGYWRKKLAGAPALLELPTDYPRPAVQSFRGGLRRLILPLPLAESLRAFSRRQGITLFMTLLAAFKVLIYRYSGQDDIVIGTGIANRRLQQFEGLLGMIINTVVLRTDLSGDPSFDELLARVRKVCLEAYAYQDIPFEMLVEALQPKRSLSYTPLFQVFFAFLDTPMPDLELPGMSLNLMDAHNGTAKFDLNMTVIPHSEQRMGIKPEPGESEITLLLEYNTEIFDEATIVRMLRHYETLLENLIGAHQQSISSLEMLTQEESRKLLCEWNNTYRNYPRDKCIHQIFESQAEQTPNATALISSEQDVTYGELNGRANQLARYLQRLGVGPEAAVGVHLQRSVEMIVALLAILKAGGAYVPLDPSYPKQRLLWMAEDSHLNVLLTQSSLLPSPPENQLEIVYLDTQREEIERESPLNLTASASPDNLAYILYTSGSTGKPKGVCVAHRAVLRLVINNYFADLSPAHTLLQFAPLAFDASTFEIWGALLNGARLLIAPPQASSLQQLGDLLKQHQVSTAWLTAGLFHLLVGERLQDLSSLSQLLAGGDVLSPRHVQKVLEELPGCRLINGYGPTEATTFSCCQRLSRGSEVGDSVLIGGPIANTRVYVLDEQMRVVPEGVEGELYIGGEGLARNYLNEAGETAEKFVPDGMSEESGGRLYRSGDRVRWRRGGELEFRGRQDRQVKVRGYRVEMGEVEKGMKEEGGVKEAAVEVRGEGEEKRLVGYVVWKEGEERGVGEMRERLKKKLPEYMVPSVIVEMEEMPLNANGKVDRAALPNPQQERGRLEKQYVPPRTSVEMKLARKWAEVLQIDQIGVFDNFFDLGGHSLLATQLVSRLAEEFQVSLSLRQFFEAPTVADLAVAVLQNQAEQNDHQEIAQILAELEQLSEEEARSILTEQAEQMIEPRDAQA